MTKLEFSSRLCIDRVFDSTLAYYDFCLARMSAEEGGEKSEGHRRSSLFLWALFLIYIFDYFLLKQGVLLFFLSIPSVMVSCWYTHWYVVSSSVSVQN